MMFRSSEERRCGQESQAKGAGGTEKGRREKKKAVSTSCLATDMVI